MAKIYYNLVKDGKWDIADVPSRWRSEVEKMLKNGK